MKRLLLVTALLMATTPVFAEIRLTTSALLYHCHNMTEKLSTSLCRNYIMGVIDGVNVGDAWSQLGPMPWPENVTEPPSRFICLGDMSGKYADAAVITAIVIILDKLNDQNSEIQNIDAAAAIMLAAQHQFHCKKTPGGKR
jgi:hypothetical protein